MTIYELRKSLGLSQADFAKVVGLTSKSHVCGLESEKGAPCSVRVALKIEELSKHQIDAASLNPDVARVRQAAAQADAAA